jgi:Tat protein secretion system quality control protein TatD with DNase activity
MPVPKLEYPQGFVSFLQQQQQQEDESFVYYDAGCDMSATIEYLRSGRGKHKISQKEAIEEYHTALDHAANTCGFGGMISRTVLPKPNRHWIDPSPLTTTNTSTNIYYVLGLSASSVSVVCDNDDDSQQQETTIQRLIETLQGHPKKIVGIWSSLNYTSDVLSQPSCDRDSQLQRLRCCCEAAGRTKVPLQVQTSPGAAGLDSEQSSVAGTDYAKVLLDLQTILSESVSKHPDLLIHLSCWSGRADHMMSLLSAFPHNLKLVGMDGSVSFTKATHLHECAFEIPLASLVLETSTVIPSHVANALGRDASFHSGWWPFVAEAVAHYKKVPIADVARAASENTLQLYPQLLGLVTTGDGETQENTSVLEECQEAETTREKTN